MFVVLLLTILLEHSMIFVSARRIPIQNYQNDDYVTSETYHVPFRSYNVRRFYPQSQISGFGYHHPGLIGDSLHHGAGYFGGGLGLFNGYGGQSVSRSGYDSGNKHINDGGYNRAYGNSAGNAHQDQLGHNGERYGLYNSQGDSAGYFDDVGGQKKVEDGSSYSGGRYTNQGAENSDQQKQKSYRKKGRVVKGFKKSHHSDETSNTEEHYDEEHSEGEAKSYKGEKGSYGADGHSSYNGLSDNSYYNAGQKQNKGNFDNQAFLGKHNLEEGKYGHSNILSKGDVFGSNSGYDADSILGHQESADFHKKYHHVPFFHH